MKKIAILAIAIIMVLSMVATALMLAYTPDVMASSQTDVTTTVNTVSSEHTSNSVLLVDRSGSTKGMTVTGSDYSDVVNFSSGLGVVGGYSEIAEALNETLIAGYDRIGIVTDCEETHKDGSTDWKALTGSYDSVEISIFLTEEYEDNDVQASIAAVMSVIDTATCTFKVFKADGTLYYAGCDNYKQEQEPVATTTYHTESTEGNKVPLSLVVILVEVAFLVFCIMAILLLALCGGNGKTGSTPVGTAIRNSDSVLLDGSASVGSSYKKMIKFCRKEGKTEVIRFADSVQEMSLSEAENTLAGGGTRGYQAMQMAYSNGFRVVTILTDGQFNDEESQADGVTFEHIYFVGASLKEQDVQHLKKFGKIISIIAL